MQSLTISDFHLKRSSLNLTRSSYHQAPSGTASTSNISVHLGQLITATETTSVHALDRQLINCLDIEASSISAAQHISSGDTSTLHAVNAVPSNFNILLASRYTLPVITTGRWFSTQPHRDFLLRHYTHTLSS
ncbi:hypothetical protein TYRP_009592 [Tyrophagus putrescentiae]|nr:hypothetical protein TYRP_009592 [Tyrophagus putrescentiae]